MAALFVSACQVTSKPWRIIIQVFILIYNHSGLLIYSPPHPTPIALPWDKHLQRSCLVQVYWKEQITGFYSQMAEKTAGKPLFPKYSHHHSSSLLLLILNVLSELVLQTFVISLSTKWSIFSLSSPIYFSLHFFVLPFSNGELGPFCSVTPPPLFLWISVPMHAHR